MKVVFTFFTLLFFVRLESQTSFRDRIIGSLQRNNVPIEKIFIHTNKTFYFVDDVIWFKAYIGNKLNAPSLATTQLTVSLLDTEQRAVLSKSIFIYKGMGKGQFELNATLAPGKYIVRAYTENSLNFDEAFIHAQEITILGKVEDTNFQNKSKFDVQVFPEGGYLLENAENTVGIKALKNGKGYNFSGKILNSRNEIVQEFKEEHFGMTHCKFWYEKSESYTAHIVANDTTIIAKVPPARKQGVLLKAASHGDSICINLETNRETLNSKKREFHLLAHQRNTVNGFLKIETPNKLKSSICSSNSAFPSGVNTVTLFEDNKPIAERKFFVEKVNDRIKASIEKTGQEFDSVKYRLSFQNQSYPVQADFSMSILPVGSKNFHQKQNIKSAFLLKPFVKGHIENPAYYFDEGNPKRKQHLDLLLLTQGWTGYSLDSMMECLDPHSKYDFKSGYRITGEILGPLKNSHLVLISNKDELIDKIFLNGKHRFSFNNLLIHKGDTLKIAFIDSLNRITKLDKMRIDAVLQKNPEPKPSFLKREIGYNNPNRTQADNINLQIDWYETGVLALDEVLITGKKINETFLKRRKVIKKLAPLVLDIGQYYEVPLPEKFENFNNDLLAFLDFDQNVTLANFQGVENYLKVPFGEALLFLNGKEITSEKLAHLNVPMTEVEHIMLKTIHGKDRVYQVFTNTNYENNIIELFTRYVAKDGYDMAKTYYKPQYDFPNALNMEWQEIDWKPYLKTNEKGEVSITVPKKRQQDKYLFSIQGFTQEGLLISKILHN